MKGKTRALTEDLRRYHRGLILELVLRHGALSRNELAAHTQLTGAAVSRISRELLDAGLLGEYPLEPGVAGRGRPTTALELARHGAFVVGVGIGAYEQWLQIADLRGECVARRALEVLRRGNGRQAVAALAGEVKRLVRETAIPKARVRGVGVCLAGVVDHERGVVIDSPNIGWKDVALAEPLAGVLGYPVRIESMHHAYNLADAYDAPAQGPSDSVLVNIAMGIGASVMEHGRILRGAHAAAGQIGHMRVPRASELCTCGRRGCLDTVASGYSVLRRLRAIPARSVPREHRAVDARKLYAVLEHERRGDRKIQAAFRASGERLGQALNALRAIIDPARIVLAGPLSRAQSYVDGVRSFIEPLPVSERTPASPLVHISKHSSDSAAARLALASFVFSAALDPRLA